MEVSVLPSRWCLRIKFKALLWFFLISIPLISFFWNLIIIHALKRLLVTAGWCNPLTEALSSAGKRIQHDMTQQTDKGDRLLLGCSLCNGPQRSLTHIRKTYLAGFARVKPGKRSGLPDLDKSLMALSEAGSSLALNTCLLTKLYNRKID